LRLNWQLQKANTVWWQMLWHFLGSIGRLFGRIFGVFGKTAAKTTNANKDLEASGTQSTTALENMNNSLYNTIKATYEAAHWFYWAAGKIDLAAKMIQAGFAWATDPLNTEKMDAFTATADAYNTNQGLLESGPWVEEMMGWGPAWGPNDYIGEFADQTGEGTGTGEGGTGEGSGKDSKGFKSKAYTVDFVLCSKKTLPPLDPNLFKSKPLLDLTQKTFKVDNIHINTRDKPDVIASTMKTTIVDIAKSQRVNITTQESKKAQV